MCSSSTIVCRRGRRLERSADRVGDQTERLVFGSRRADAGVNDDAEQAERVRAIELVDERGRASVAERRRRGRQVDQIARVRHDGRDAGLLDAAAEPADVGRIERLADQLARVLREDLQRFAAMQHRPFDGVRPRHRPRTCGANTHERRPGRNTTHGGPSNSPYTLTARHPAQMTVLLALAVGQTGS